MNIVFLGSGNTATVLAKHMLKCGHVILQVWSRNELHANRLAKKVNAHAITDLNNIDPFADLYILALNDQVIGEIASQLSLQKKVVVHTAGSVSMHVLKTASHNYGVLYPLQSLQKEVEIKTEIPFLIDGNSDEVKVLLNDFARTLSTGVSFADDTERLHMHIAAVIVNNFTNHLFVLAKEYCSNHHLDFKLLFPLIQQTALTVTEAAPEIIQTGPAKRNDVQTIQKHLEILKDDVALGQLYQIFSESITTYHKNNELRNS
jgi:predicted short-subunit dehydrogenase-like oxidoreductase (DUF2520 family)